MSLTKQEIFGVFPPVVTPFTPEEELDLDAFRREVHHYLQFRIGGLLVGAATGEGYSLPAEESEALYRTAVEEAAGKVPVIAGILANSTRDALTRARAARDAGAGAVMATPVTYFRPSDAGMVDYYRSLAEEGGLPVVVYNSMAHIPISVPVARQIAALPQVIAFKQGMGGDLIALSQLVEAVGDQVAVTWSQDTLLFPGFALGAVGSFAGMDTVVTERTVEMFEAVQRADLDSARKLHSPVTRVARVCGYPSGIKAAVNLQGRAVGVPRRPYAPLSDDERSVLQAALLDAGAL